MTSIMTKPQTILLIYKHPHRGNCRVPFEYYLTTNRPLPRPIWNPAVKSASRGLNNQAHTDNTDPIFIPLNGCRMSVLNFLLPIGVKVLSIALIRQHCLFLSRDETNSRALEVTPSILIASSGASTWNWTEFL